MRRNLTLAEKKEVQKIAPNLNLKNWLIRKKRPEEYILQHKETGTKRIIPVEE